MDEEIKKFLFNPTVGKIVAVLIGVAVIWLIIKALQKNLFSKIKDSDNRYRASRDGNATTIPAPATPRATVTPPSLLL